MTVRFEISLRFSSQDQSLSHRILTAPTCSREHLENLLCLVSFVNKPIDSSPAATRLITFSDDDRMRSSFDSHAPLTFQRRFLSDGKECVRCCAIEFNHQVTDSAYSCDDHARAAYDDGFVKNKKTTCRLCVALTLAVARSTNRIRALDLYRQLDHIAMEKSRIVSFLAI